MWINCVYHSINNIIHTIFDEHGMSMKKINIFDSNNMWWKLNAFGEKNSMIHTIWYHINGYEKKTTTKQTQ